jgi:hypothetical protein
MPIAFTDSDLREFLDVALAPFLLLALVYLIHKATK